MKLARPDKSPCDGVPCLRVGRAGRLAWLPATAGLLLAVSVLPGCGYSARGPFRTDIESVHVEVFDSREFRRDIEYNLTEAVKKRIGADTPYRVVSKERADTILRGELLEERQAAFAPDVRSRLPRETQLVLALRVEWKDLRSGQVLFERSFLLQGVDYVTPVGETEKFAQQKAVDGLARRIVRGLYEEW